MSTAGELRNRAKRRSLTIQSVIVVLTLLAIWGAVSNAQYNLTRLNMTSGFSFLERDTGWDYSFSLIERSINDRYYYTLFVGLLNTLFVGFICIVTTTFLGFIIGTMRDARHPALSFAANVYVQIFRNIPLILQAINFGDIAFLSGRGMMLPGLNVGPGVAVGMLLASAAIGIGLIVGKVSLWRGLAIWFGGTIIVSFLTAVILRPQGEGLFIVPALAGVRFTGGISVPIELLALVVSITLYGSAYIAEIVRGCLSQVPRGLVEAGQALGMSQVSIWSRIKVPMALLSIIPPLGNQ